MRPLAERETADQPRPSISVMPTPPTMPTPTMPRPNLTTEEAWATPENLHRGAWKAGVLGAISVLVMVVSVRLLVLVSVMGAIALAWASLGNPDLNRQIILGIYGVLVVVPCVYLATMGK